MLSTINILKNYLNTSVYLNAVEYITLNKSYSGTGRRYLTNMEASFSRSKSSLFDSYLFANVVSAVIQYYRMS